MYTGIAASGAAANVAAAEIAGIEGAKLLAIGGLEIGAAAANCIIVGGVVLIFVGVSYAGYKIYRKLRPAQISGENNEILNDPIFLSALQESERLMKLNERLLQDNERLGVIPAEMQQLIDTLSDSTCS